MRVLLSVVVGFATAALVTVAAAQSTTPATTTASADPATAQVDSLRDQLKAAYQRGDVNGMLKYLHPQVVIVFPDGEILQGRDALAGYYDKMLKAPGHVVQSYTSKPVVSERYLHGDTVVSFGRMNDHYVLTDGTRFGLDSRFTVTALRLRDGPPETSGWVIRSFHSSTDAFENPVLGIAMRKAAAWASAAGVVVGMIIGVISALLIRRRRRSSSAT